MQLIHQVVNPQEGVLVLDGHLMLTVCSPHTNVNC